MAESRTLLLREHEMIDVLARSLSRMIDEQASPQALATTLEHLADLVAAHLAHEDCRIYTLAMQARPGATRESVERAEREFEQLRSRWGEYLTLWTPEAIAADRDAFVAATRRMLPRLQDRVRLETQLLLATALHRDASQGAA